MALSAVAGTCVFVLVRTTVHVTPGGWHELWTDPCDEQVELRVLTTPETREMIQNLADRFANDHAASQRCRPVHVTAYAASSVTAVRESFCEGFRETSATRLEFTILGPRPDVRIPASSAEVDDVAPLVSQARLEDRGSIATSPLVLAVPARHHPLPRVQQDASSITELVTAAHQMAQRVARPNPDTSEVGLLATVGLYGGRTSATNPVQRQFIEKLVTPTGMPLSNAVDLLCSFRRQGHDVSLIPAVVPEHVVHDYNMGRPLGDDCPERGAALRTGDEALLTAYYPDDTPALDYPFVHVMWEGQTDRYRESMIHSFRDWLSVDRLRDEG